MIFQVISVRLNLFNLSIKIQLVDRQDLILQPILRYMMISEISMPKYLNRFQKVLNQSFSPLILMVEDVMSVKVKE